MCLCAVRLCVVRLCSHACVERVQVRHSRCLLVVEVRLSRVGFVLGPLPGITSFFRGRALKIVGYSETRIRMQLEQALALRLRRKGGGQNLKWNVRALGRGGASGQRHAQARPCKRSKMHTAPHRHAPRRGLGWDTRAAPRVAFAWVSAATWARPPPLPPGTRNPANFFSHKPHCHKCFHHRHECFSMRHSPSQLPL